MIFMSSFILPAAKALCTLIFSGGQAPPILNHSE